MWTVTFLSEGGDLPLMTANGNRLTGSNVGNAVHEIASGTSPLGGTFRLSLGNEVSTPIPFDADSQIMEESLESLGSLADASALSVDVVRTGPDSTGGYVWTVSFMSSVGDIPALEADTEALKGASSIIICSDGDLRQGCEDRMTRAGNAVRGSFTLTYRTQTTMSLPYDATAQSVQRALEALPALKPKDPLLPSLLVTRSKASNVDGYVWSVTFVGSSILGNVPQLVASREGLTRLLPLKRSWKAMKSRARTRCCLMRNSTRLP